MPSISLKRPLDVRLANDLPDLDFTRSRFPDPRFLAIPDLMHVLCLRRFSREWPRFGLRRGSCRTQVSLLPRALSVELIAPRLPLHM